MPPKIASAQATQTSQDSAGQNQTSGMYDRPALSYGLFHAHARPNKAYGIITTGISFKGVMMDVGHSRAARWVNDTNPAIHPTNGTVSTADPIQAAKDRWISYNRMRGEYASALEAAIPERFFNDFTKCNAPGADATTTPPYDPSKPACAEGISAVKAIAIAASQGQKLFTITSANAAQALPLLSHRVGVMDEIQNAISAGKEVQIHESTITANGWTGSGYVVIDPETGAGAYLIEGGANGAIALGIGISTGALLIGSIEMIIKMPPALWAGPLIALAGSIAITLVMMGQDDFVRGCFFLGLGYALQIAGAAALPNSPILMSKLIQFIAAALGVSASVFDVTGNNQLQTCLRGPMS